MHARRILFSLCTLSLFACSDAPESTVPATEVAPSAAVTAPANSPELTAPVAAALWLKRATPQNIVIGGVAGAAPPLLGWAAMTNEVHPHALLLVLIIFVWTPPHFWALAIFRRDDYAAADIPMLPVTHGVEYTRWQVLYYTILLVPVSILPYLTGMTTVFYLGGALILGAAFLYYAWRLLNPPDELFAMKVFRYSIIYLMALFAFLLVDHYLPRTAPQEQFRIQFTPAQPVSSAVPLPRDSQFPARSLRDFAAAP